MALSLEALVADKPEVRLVHQRRRVERLPGLLAGESRCRELAQLVVDHGQQIGRRLTIAPVRGFEQSCNLAHGVAASCSSGVASHPQSRPFSSSPAQISWPSELKENSLAPSEPSFRWMIRSSAPLVVSQSWSTLSPAVMRRLPSG